MAVHRLHVPHLLAAPTTRRRPDKQSISRSLYQLVLALNDAQADLRLCSALSPVPARARLSAVAQACAQLADELQRPLLMLLSVLERRGTLLGAVRRGLWRVRESVAPAAPAKRVDMLARRSLKTVMRRYAALLELRLPGPLAREIETQRLFLWHELGGLKHSPRA